MVGSALHRYAAECGSWDIISASRSVLDLGDAAATTAFLHVNRPDVVIVAAARVGGRMGAWA